MCKFNSGCRGNCRGHCSSSTTIREVVKNVSFDSSNIAQGPEGPALVPEETDDVFNI